MIEFLLTLDRNLLVKLNSWHAPWLDPVMFTLTNGLNWLPLFLLVIGVMVYKIRWQTLIILLFAGLVIFLADRISAGLLKPWFARLRPSHEPGLENFLHFVNGYKGGLYGFVSSHAANAFGIATFLWLILRKQITWIWIMFPWAIIFSYTRIYLGVHYPFDILGGGVLGALIGLLVYKLARLMPARISPIPAVDELPSS
jgi:undecaprenyl-diphosphatase